jgi:hypothetical protein
MKQIDSRTKVVKACKASKFKRSTDLHSGFSFMILAERVSYELSNLSEKAKVTIPDFSRQI